MARRPRRDGPDTWHHAMNRTMSRRTLFENDEDRRFFLSLLAREVRNGRIEVHAYSLMLTHFHLLVRSVTGELSAAMRRIQNRYARRFNRTRKRDGSLFRGRFLSRRIDDLAYRRNVVTYIHDNAIAAGVVAHAADHLWSSAHHLARPDRPRWLATDWIDDECRRRGGGAVGAAALDKAFPSRIDEDFRRWVEIQLSKRLPDELEDVSLRHAGSPRVLNWTIRKAKLADGTRPWLPVAPAKLVANAIERAKAKVGPLLGRFAQRAKDAWVNLGAGLLRLLAGCAHYEIGLRVGRHASTISRDLRDHARLLESDPDYAGLHSRLAHVVLEAVR